jgi:hypothetical protein
LNAPRNYTPFAFLEENEDERQNQQVEDGKKYALNMQRFKSHNGKTPILRVNLDHQKEPLKELGVGECTGQNQRKIASEIALENRIQNSHGALNHLKKFDVDLEIYDTDEKLSVRLKEPQVCRQNNLGQVTD